MAGELATSRRKVERSTIELERKHLEVEAPAAVHRDDPRAHHDRRRVARRGRHGHDDQQRGARGCSASIAPSSASRRRAVFARQDLQPLGALLAGAGRAERASRRRRRSRFRATARKSTSPSWRRRSSATAASPEGQLLVLDDVTPLIRAQKVAAWREVARRLAHEIKNPLTPIQLSAERLRRHFAGAPSGARALVDECTATIVGEVESLKGLVDEFSQFARMPTPRTVPDRSARAHRRHADALRRPVHRRDDRAAVCAGRAARAARPRADPARHHQPRRQRHRGHGAPRPDRRRDAARRGQPSRADHRRRRRPGHSAGRTREAVPAVLLDETAAAAASGWRSCGGSSRSTAAASKPATTSPRGTRFTIELPC